MADASSWTQITSNVFFCFQCTSAHACVLVWKSQKQTLYQRRQRHVSLKPACLTFPAVVPITVQLTPVACCGQKEQLLCPHGSDSIKAAGRGMGSWVNLLHTHLAQGDTNWLSLSEKKRGLGYSDLCYVCKDLGICSPSRKYYWTGPYG